MASKPGYRQLLRTPGAWSFLLPGFLARQPFAMLTIGIVLLVQHTTGSFGTAGVVSATTGVAMALCAPQAGKLVDRFGQRAVLLPGALLHAGAVSLLTVLALTGAPLWALLLTAVPAGASVPQVGPMVRARWSHRLGGGPLMPTAAAFESVTDEFTFVVGPVLATALCTGVHPAAGLAAEAALTVVGGLLFAAQTRTAPPAHRRAAAAGRKPGSALAVPGVPVLITVFLGIGAVFGGMQVSLTAFTQAIGQPGANGLLYGVFAGGNMLAGVLCGVIAWRSAPHRRLPFAYGTLALTTVPLFFAASAGSVWLLGAVGLLVGLATAPSMITGFTLVERLVPAGTRTEAFTWLTGAVALGQALATTTAGQFADGFGAAAGFTVPLIGTALAAVTVATLRRRLVPPAEEGADGRVVARGAGHRVPVPVD
ncbi:MFS transporter [Streptomyces sp. TRM 70351]|uniref:MFS transporter n=1 Tax=Streptomyces sp. TRM 70351 TaxID=3116552 RepID=UPI002E7ABF87|nr:MFS transporter [Streptomyces sp. TRM 70351]MEE1929496.1 MFS transporter [Streptomyces sp. TRM 70351]